MGFTKVRSNSWVIKLPVPAVENFPTGDGWMEIDLISDIHLLNKTFPGGRPTSSGKHQKWDKLFIRVKPPDADSE
jgi:hypothetical protein